MTTILIVEDELIIRRMYAQKMKQAGFRVLEASDGKTGLQIAQQENPKVILLDIKMPIMNGLEMLRQLRISDWASEIKVILLTNVDPDDKTLAAITAGQPSYYLIKSNNRPELVLEKVIELANEENNGKNSFN